MAGSAASNTVALPKNSLVKKVRVSDPPFSSLKGGDRLVDQSVNYVNRSIRDLRQLDKKVAIRAFVRVNGMVSAAVQSYINLAMSGYSVTAYDNASHLFSPEGTLLGRSLLARLNTLNDYSSGYVDKRPVEQLLETMLLEAVITGSVGAELVLDKYRLPDRIVPISSDPIEWRVKKDKRKYPVQRSSTGNDIPLDFPTVFFEGLNQDASTVYPYSMLESCLNTVFIFLEFLEDMSRVLRRSGHTRLVGYIKIAEAVQSAPVEVQNDKDKLTNYLISLKGSVEDSLKDLEPEEAIVSYDNVEFEMLSSKGEKSDYTGMLEALNGLVASSLKSMPSALGLRIGTGSQSLSNTETLLYLKSVEALRKPVEAVMSRALTLAARLTGSPTYIKFTFDPVDLRPKTETASHLSVRQSMILDQLSLGFLTDDEASHLLGAGVRPAGAPKLSGTLFRHSQSVSVDETKITPNNGAQEKALTPDGPSSAPGRPKEN